MVAQQVAVADEEGYIEEMINGQKVVKVFNHEDAAKQGFDKLNDKLNDDSRKAHTYGNILMPILGNMGNLLYVLLAFIGGLLVISEINTGFKNVGITGFNPLTVGVLVSFLSLSRQLSNNIGNIAGQISMVTMGLAGASRVFDMIDEQQETDNGYVMLVNATKDENGNIVESEKRTGLWAWKHYHKETDITTYVELKGDIELDDVDSVTSPTNSCCTAYPFAQNPVRNSLSSAQRARAKRQSPTLSTGFTTFRTAKSATTG